MNERMNEMKKKKKKIKIITTNFDLFIYFSKCDARSTKDMHCYIYLDKSATIADSMPFLTEWHITSKQMRF